MRARTFLLLFTLTIISTIYVSCTKVDDGLDEWGLPDATQDGRGVFACLINGVPWQPKVDLNWQTFLDGEKEILAYTYEHKEVHIKALQHFTDKAGKKYYQEFSIGIDSLASDNSFNDKKWGISYFNIYGEDYRMDTSYSGNHLTLSRCDEHVRGVLAGEFECRLISDNKKDTLNITHGRFDCVWEF